MEELLSNLIPQLLNNFDFIFMFVVNTLIYLIIKFINNINI